MKLTVTGRHIEITDGIRDHLDNKLGKLIGDLDDHVDTHVILSTEKHRHWAEITVRTKGNSLHVKEETNDLYPAIDLAVDKMEKLLRKRKDRAISIKSKESQKKSDKGS